MYTLRRSLLYTPLPRSSHLLERERDTGIHLSIPSHPLEIHSGVRPPGSQSFSRLSKKKGKQAKEFMNYILYVTTVHVHVHVHVLTTIPLPIITALELQYLRTYLQDLYMYMYRTRTVIVNTTGSLSRVYCRETCSDGLCLFLLFDSLSLARSEP